MSHNDAASGPGDLAGCGKKWCRSCDLILRDATLIRMRSTLSITCLTLRRPEGPSRRARQAKINTWASSRRRGPPTRRYWASCKGAQCAVPRRHSVNRRQPDPRTPCQGQASRRGSILRSLASRPTPRAMSWTLRLVADAKRSATANSRVGSRRWDPPSRS